MARAACRAQKNSNKTNNDNYINTTPIITIATTIRALAVTFMMISISSLRGCGSEEEEKAHKGIVPKGFFPKAEFPE
eukprot:1575244-Amphidinium_carterae.1